MPKGVFFLPSAPRPARLRHQPGGEGGGVWLALKDSPGASRGRLASLAAMYRPYIGDAWEYRLVLLTIKNNVV